MESGDLKKIYRKNPETISKMIDGELIILALGNEVKVSDLGSFYVLKNKTSLYIWELIEGKMSVADIRDAVCEKFDVEPERAETDILKCLRELNKIKAII